MTILWPHEFSTTVYTPFSFPLFPHRVSLSFKRCGPFYQTRGPCSRRSMLQDQQCEDPRRSILVSIPLVFRCRVGKDACLVLTQDNTAFAIAWECSWLGNKP